MGWPEDWVFSSWFLFNTCVTAAAIGLLFLPLLGHGYDNDEYFLNESIILRYGFERMKDTLAGERLLSTVHFESFKGLGNWDSGA